MSGKPVIQIAGLGKQYRLGTRQSNRTFREAITETIAHRLRSSSKASLQSTVWALRDITFAVRAGEVVGIVGRNGAGKSTLLKILSRITDPTEGGGYITGRVGSLLEVGTGFHSELTGRENIYLNGAILGMKRAEIRRRFDSIVSYAEIENFLDTAVKHYSSGMYMRLAFSVAAHLEPEILIIDEVLAVGDAEFQKKCLGKISAVAKEGRTVLFVSHNMAAVRALCQRAILLENGRIVQDASPEITIATYQSLSKQTGGVSWRRANAHRGNLSLEAVDLALLGEQPTLQLLVNIEAASNGPHLPAFAAVDISDAIGVPLMQALPTGTGFLQSDATNHQFRIRISLPALIPGLYYASVWLGSHFSETLDWAHQCVSFEVATSPSPGRTFPHTLEHGQIVPASTLETIA